MLRKQLDAAAKGRVVNQIPGRRRYDPKYNRPRMRKPRGRVHLLRPDNTGLSMCGLVKRGVWSPAEVTCKICENMYANNPDWYEKQLREESDELQETSD